jgi:hypothetical protein
MKIRYLVACSASLVGAFVWAGASDGVFGNAQARAFAFEGLRSALGFCTQYEIFVGRRTEQTSAQLQVPALNQSARGQTESVRPTRLMSTPSQSATQAGSGPALRHRAPERPVVRSGPAVVPGVEPVKPVIHPEFAALNPTPMAHVSPLSKPGAEGQPAPMMPAPPEPPAPPPTPAVQRAHASTFQSEAWAAPSVWSKWITALQLNEQRHAEARAVSSRPNEMGAPETEQAMARSILVVSLEALQRVEQGDFSRVVISQDGQATRCGSPDLVPDCAEPLTYADKQQTLREMRRDVKQARAELDRASRKSDRL